MLARLRIFFEKYERHLTTGALVFGFIFDFFTLTRIDQLYDNVVLAFYLGVVAAGIFLFNYLEVKEPTGVLWKNIRAFSPTIVQFAFGGLFSGISIFYLRSATFSVNIVFILILFGLLVGNEFFREKYKKLAFQLSVFYFVLYSYLIFSIPVLVKSIGALVFVLSGIVSLGVIAGVLLIFRKYMSKRFEASKQNVFASIAVIFVGMNLLYFLNIIPPIPLSLKDVDAYSRVYRSGGNYIALEEARFFNPFDTVRIREGQPIFVFSSVFSPTDLETEIVHHWQYFDGDVDRWRSAGRISFSIVGGREDGFRGFTQKSNIFEGAWRVDVETLRGQLIGRETFRIQYVDVLPELYEKVL